MERYGLGDCFTDFWKSKAVEHDVDDEIFRYYCEKSGIEKVFWGSQTMSRLAEVCREECPYFRNAVEQAYAQINGGRDNDDS